MAILFECANCGKRLKAPEDRVGQRARCRECGELTAVPEADEPEFFEEPTPINEFVEESRTDKETEGQIAQPAQAVSKKEEKSYGCMPWMIGFALLFTIGVIKDFYEQAEYEKEEAVALAEREREDLKEREERLARIAESNRLLEKLRTEREEREREQADRSTSNNSSSSDSTSSSSSKSPEDSIEASIDAFEKRDLFSSDYEIEYLVRNTSSKSRSVSAVLDYGPASNPTKYTADCFDNYRVGADDIITGTRTFESMRKDLQWRIRITRVR